ncbi:MAG: ABC transporter permease [Cyanobacteriota bacterium]|nr:ABC transporter permease [Cyanobacteriota bacterium]
MNALATFFYQRQRLGLALLLALPLAWLVGFYLLPLLALLLQSFFQLDPFTGLVVRQFTWATYRQLFIPAHLDILGRTLIMAGLVTLACGGLAFPIAYTMTHYASPRLKGILYVMVLLPLWSNYLIRVYAWKLILAKEGILTWLIQQIHLEALLQALLHLPGIGGPSLAVSWLGIFVVFIYVWLPYMILPIQAALERIPVSLIEAAADLGSPPQQTFWRVIWPLALPGVVAGSVFTFSLTLGDFVVPYTLGNSSYFIGQAVLSFQGTSGNIPLAAAFTVVPMVIMILYLWAAKKLGAFDPID